MQEAGDLALIENAHGLKKEGLQVQKAGDLDSRGNACGLGRDVLQCREIAHLDSRRRALRNEKNGVTNLRKQCSEPKKRVLWTRERFGLGLRFPTGASTRVQLIRLRERCSGVVARETSSAMEMHTKSNSALAAFSTTTHINHQGRTTSSCNPKTAPCLRKKPRPVQTPCHPGA